MRLVEKLAKQYSETNLSLYHSEENAYIAGFEAAREILFNLLEGHHTAHFCHEDADIPTWLIDRQTRDKFQKLGEEIIDEKSPSV